MAAHSDSSAPVITPEADRVLGRIILRYGAATFVLLLLMTVVMSVVNALIPGPLHRFLDTLGILLVLLPFFVGINKLFAARLAIGRTLVQRRQYPQAIAALDPFAGPTQRFLDKSGEAHYLLAVAYKAVGDTARAQSARAFVQKHRPGAWSARLSSAAPKQDIRPAPPKHGPKRRH